MNNIDRVIEILKKYDDYLDKEKALRNNYDLAKQICNSQWIDVRGELPEKPGKEKYEYVWCLIYINGQIAIHPWNCEHLCWDNIDMDDHAYDAKTPTHWQPLPDAPNSWDEGQRITESEYNVD
jgi:hypothetical protein